MLITFYSAARIVESKICSWDRGIFVEDRLLSSTKELEYLLQSLSSSFCWSATGTPFGFGPVASAAGHKASCNPMG